MSVNYCITLQTWVIVWDPPFIMLLYAADAGFLGMNATHVLSTNILWKHSVRN
jgi:hypothetical protein